MQCFCPGLAFIIANKPRIYRFMEHITCAMLLFSVQSENFYNLNIPC